jgi:hypothetical protein
MPKTFGYADCENSFPVDFMASGERWRNRNERAQLHIVSG